MAAPTWQVTVTTTHCDAVDDYVTLIVYNDRSARCGGYKQYGDNITKKTAKELQRKSKKLGKELRCEGPECHRVIEYRDKIFAEEEAKAKS